MKKLLLPIFLILGITMVLGFVSAQNTTQCTDSDSGKDYYNLGHTRGIETNTSGSLVVMPDGSYDFMEEQDSCKDNVLTEWYCQNSGAIGAEDFNCPNGCSNGACISLNQTTCTDSDEGKNVYKEGLTKGKYSGNNDEITEIFDYCISPSILNEAYCDGEYAKVEHINCPEGYVCENINKNEGEDGRCVKTESNKGCIDSDGEDKFTKGHVDINNIRNADDICYDGSNVIEYFCSYSEAIGEEIADKKIISCTTGCRDGACISEEGENGIEEKPVEIPTEIVEKGEYVCDGCSLDKKCYPYGFRKDKNYCDDKTSTFIIQNVPNSVCENNFECDSNLCINNQCVNGSLWAKFIRWLNRLFGGE